MEEEALRSSRRSSFLELPPLAASAHACLVHRSSSLDLDVEPFDASPGMRRGCSSPTPRLPSATPTHLPHLVAASLCYRGASVIATKGGLGLLRGICIALPHGLHSSLPGGLLRSSFTLSHVCRVGGGWLSASAESSLLAPCCIAVAACALGLCGQVLQLLRH